MKLRWPMLSLPPINLWSMPKTSKSPCTGKCYINTQGWCGGCGRTLEEIAQWHRLPAKRHEQIIKNAERRLHESTK